jgi:adenine-specific DNA-methyltransferase
MLMTTKPGDLVLDPTCGSGTTAYVAEEWGRRWITIDTSRVPLALARQRLLTATFPYYQLKDDARGPASGFVYARRQNSKGAEVGGIVPHITSSTIANDEPPEETLIVDRSERVSGVTRVAGPFCVEATIPTPVDWDGDGGLSGGAAAEDYGSYLDRMLDVLRRAPVLQLGGGKSVALRNVRPPAKSLALSAEATVEAAASGETIGFGEALAAADEQNLGALPFSQKPVALVFGPENGAVSERLVFEAAREAHAKNYAHLYVIGFAIQPNARALIENCDSAVGVPATYVQATPDLMMGDLLKTMRSSQIFSVCGMPDVHLRKHPPEGVGQPSRFEVELLGLDVFDPATMQPAHLKGDDVPAWLLDTDYNGLVFHGNQVFFPRTGAWEHLKKALKATHDESVWDHLAGTVSAPFEGGEHRQIAVKVIDDRGNELIVVKPLAAVE